MQNRMEFGRPEDETGMDDETVGLGMIGAGTGRVRGETVDAKSKGKLSKRLTIILETELMGLKRNCPVRTRSEPSFLVDQPSPPTLDPGLPLRYHSLRSKGSRL